MINKRDIGQLFTDMRAIYGNLWPHSSEHDMAVWLRKLGGYNRGRIAEVVDRITKQYPKHPPTLGEFEAVVSGPPDRPNTYIAPPKMSATMAIANKTMLYIVMAAGGGLKKLTLRAMVDLKNALVSEYEGKKDEKFPRKLADQLTALMHGYEDSADG